jgi:hypothetical protein
MQDANHANPTTNEPGIAGQLLQSGGRSAKEQIVKELLSAPYQSPEVSRQGKGDHEIGYGQQQILLPLQPLSCCPILTFGAMAILAGVIAIPSFVTIQAVVNVTAHHLSPALFDRLHGLPMSKRHSVAVFLPIPRSVATEDLRQFCHSNAAVS